MQEQLNFSALTTEQAAALQTIISTLTAPPVVSAAPALTPRTRNSSVKQASTDDRKRLMLVAYKRGFTHAEIALLANVSAASVGRYIAACREAEDAVTL